MGSGRHLSDDMLLDKVSNQKYVACIRIVNYRNSSPYEGGSYALEAFYRNPNHPILRLVGGTSMEDPPLLTFLMFCPKLGKRVCIEC